MLMEMLLLGLLGSTHCLAMCGGFMLAVRGRAAAYQAGRLLGYSLAGAALASAGWAARLGLGNRLFLVAAGCGMLAMGLGLAPARVPGLARLLLILGPLLRRPFWLGLITGALPCGLLGAAWMLAATSDSPQAGALSMAAFWLGTLPAHLLARSLQPLARRYPRAGSWVVAAIGLSMLARALWPEAWCA